MHTTPQWTQQRGTLAARSSQRGKLFSKMEKYDFVAAPLDDAAATGIRFNSMQSGRGQRTSMFCNVVCVFDVGLCTPEESPTRGPRRRAFSDSYGLLARIKAARLDLKNCAAKCIDEGFLIYPELCTNKSLDDIKT